MFIKLINFYLYVAFVRVDRIGKLAFPADSLTENHTLLKHEHLLFFSSKSLDGTSLHADQRAVMKQLALRSDFTLKSQDHKLAPFKNCIRHSAPTKLPQILVVCRRPSCRSQIWGRSA